MKAQPGNMGIAEGMSLVFITTSSTIFLAAWSLAIDRTTTASWMMPLINTCTGLLTLCLLLYVLSVTSTDLYDACQLLVGTTATRLIVLYYIGIYFLDATLLLRQFAENTLLTALPELPFEIAIGWYTIIAVILSYIGIEATLRAGYIIMPLIILASFTVLTMLLPQYEILYLAPWRGPGLDKVLASGVMSSGINIGILIPAFLASSFQNTKTVKYSVLYALGLSCLVKTATLAAFIAAFGTGSAREKVLPFYELSRLVYINRYIQRIESLVIIVWAVAGILNITVLVYAGIYLLARLFNLPTLKPLILPVLLLISALAMIPEEITSVITLHTKLHFGLYNIGTMLIPFALFVMALIHAFKQKNSKKQPSCQ
ncbi:MAG: spore germination protein [Pelosinus sp.]|nr:spore germination protein [Pelosinus sp.]